MKLKAEFVEIVKLRERKKYNILCKTAGRCIGCIAGSYPEGAIMAVVGSTPTPATRPRYYLASKIIKYVDRTINQPNGRRILVN